MDYKSENGTVLPLQEALLICRVNATDDGLLGTLDANEYIDTSSVRTLVMAAKRLVDELDGVKQSQGAPTFALSEREMETLRCMERGEMGQESALSRSFARRIIAALEAVHPPEQADGRASKGKFVAVSELKNAKKLLGNIPSEFNEVAIIAGAIDCAIEALEGKALCTTCDTFTEVPE